MWSCLKASFCVLGRRGQSVTVLVIFVFSVLGGYYQSEVRKREYNNKCMIKKIFFKNGYSNGWVNTWRKISLCNHLPSALTRLWHFHAACTKYINHCYLLTHLNFYLIDSSIWLLVYSWADSIYLEDINKCWAGFQKHLMISWKMRKLNATVLRERSVHSYWIQDFTSSTACGRHCLIFLFVMCFRRQIWNACRPEKQIYSDLIQTLH